MQNIYIPTRGPSDWRAFLAKPEEHWKAGYSAMELAECWEGADGFPREVGDPLGRAFAGIRPLIALPELKVALPGGTTCSQNDIWILARYDTHLVSIAVEGKVDESFDKPISEWRKDNTKGKAARWEFLKEKLGLTGEPDGALMYQLFHRTASAIIQAEEFRADHAVLVVHSFSPAHSWFGDYAAFLKLFGVDAVRGEVQRSPKNTQVALSFLWATGAKKARPNRAC